MPDNSPGLLVDKSYDTLADVNVDEQNGDIVLEVVQSEHNKPEDLRVSQGKVKRVAPLHIRVKGLQIELHLSKKAAQSVRNLLPNRDDYVGGKSKNMATLSVYWNDTSHSLEKEKRRY